MSLMKWAILLIVAEATVAAVVEATVAAVVEVTEVVSLMRCFVFESRDVSGVHSNNTIWKR